jgi:peptidoglycan/xylan/chitin deacetylase (PgdA/CDA1 family)
MNRNFSAFCAVVLAFVIFIATFGGTQKITNTAFAEEKVIYLTFDDGPSDRVTPKILDILKEENVSATFFIIGQQAISRQQIVRREAYEGHTIAIHSYTHEYKDIYSSCDKLLSDIEKCKGIIEMITGYTPTLYRFPGGSYNLSTKLINAVKQSGYRVVDWNSSMRDAEIINPTPYQLYTSAITSAEGKDKIILLAHDSTTKLTTVQALTDVIHYFKSKDYNFKAL